MGSHYGNYFTLICSKACNQKEKKWEEWEKKNRRNEFSIILKPTTNGEPHRSKQKDIKGRPKRKGKILREIFNYSQFIRVRFSSSSSSTPQSALDIALDAAAIPMDTQRKWKFFFVSIHLAFVGDELRKLLGLCSMPRRGLDCRWGFGVDSVQCFVNNSHRATASRSLTMWERGMMEMTLFVQV